MSWQISIVSRSDLVNKGLAVLVTGTACFRSVRATFFSPFLASLAPAFT